jgi:hypothetical protein
VRMLVAEGHDGEREIEERNFTMVTKNSGSWFFGDFGLDFLLPQAMKSTSIYRGWKRIVSALQMDPNYWLKVAIMGCQFCCRYGLVRVVTLGRCHSLYGVN